MSCTLRVGLAACLLDQRRICQPVLYLLQPHQDRQLHGLQAYRARRNRIVELPCARPSIPAQQPAFPCLRVTDNAPP